MASTKKFSADYRAHVAAYQATYPIRKGYVAKLFLGDIVNPGPFKRNASVMVVMAEIKKLVDSFSSASVIPNDVIVDNNLLRPSLYNLERLIKGKLRNLNLHWTSLISLSDEIFEIPFKSLSTPNSTPSEPSSQTTFFHASHVQSFSGESSASTTDSLLPGPSAVVLSSAATSVNTGKPPSPKRLRLECDRCVTKSRTISNMVMKNTKLQKSVRQQRERLRLSLKIVSAQKAKLKRKEQSIALWKAKYHTAVQQNDTSLYIRDKLARKRARNAELKEQLRSVKMNLQILQEEHQNLNKRFYDLLEDRQRWTQTFNTRVDRRVQDERKKLQVEESRALATSQKMVIELEAKLEKASQKIVTVKNNGKRYDHKLRRCMYKCLLSNVAVSKCSDLLSYVFSTLLDMTFVDLPSTSVVAQMAYELGVLSNIQIGHLIHNHGIATLSWDSTLFDGQHINEVHITTLVGQEQKSLTINIGVISGGATGDYIDHICNSLLDVVRIYSAYRSINEMDVQSSILNSIRSTVTDRAPVNHCVVEQLEERFDLDLFDLKCHVHPLDGLATAARSTLAALDREWRNIISTPTGCIVSSVIYGLSKLRYSQGSGDPEGFKAFMMRKNLKPGTILRYVGNRIHVLFHMSATVLHLRTTLCSFLKQASTRGSNLRETILKQLANDDVQIQLQALGLFAKFLTGPWMTVIYGNKDRLSNLEISNKYKDMMTHLNTIKENPSYIYTCQLDAFDRPLDNTDQEIISVRAVVDGELNQLNAAKADKLDVAVKSLAVAFYNTLDRQLSPYLYGELSNSTEEMLALTASAPAHNMHAERALGLMDALWRRAPNATTGFIDGKSKALLNGTLQWLDELSDAEQSHAVKFAVRNGAKMRVLTAARETAAHEVQTRKLALQQGKVEKANRRNLEREITNALSANIPLATLDAFSRLSNSGQSTFVDKLDSFVRGTVSIVGDTLHHVWTIDGRDVIYLETVISVEFNRTVEGEVPKVESVCLRCQLLDDPESAESQYKMPVVQFLADCAFGDVVFVA